MGLKNLFSFLSIIAGVSMAGYFIGGIAYIHEYQGGHGPTSALVMFYFLLFIGIAVTVIGCIMAATKKRDIIYTVVLIALFALAIIFQIVALSVIQNYRMREEGFVMIILILASAAILTLANIYFIQDSTNKGGHKNGD